MDKLSYIPSFHRVPLGGDSIITSRPGGRWVYTVFLILLDGKLRGAGSTLKKISMKYFCIIKEKIAYMECAIHSLFLSILLCNVDSALVSDSNACM